MKVIQKIVCCLSTLFIKTSYSFKSGLFISCGSFCFENDRERAPAVYLVSLQGSKQPQYVYTAWDTWEFLEGASLVCRTIHNHWPGQHDMLMFNYDLMQTFPPRSPFCFSPEYNVCLCFPCPSTCFTYYEAWLLGYMRIIYVFFESFFSIWLLNTNVNDRPESIRPWETNFLKCKFHLIFCHTVIQHIIMFQVV